MKFKITLTEIDIKQAIHKYLKDEKRIFAYTDHITFNRDNNELNAVCDRADGINKTKTQESVDGEYNGKIS